jgi:hypothetical protein
MVWDPMPQLTVTSPYVDARVDSNTFTMGNPNPMLCRVDLNPVPRSTLSASQGLRILPQGQTKKGSLSHEANQDFCVQSNFIMGRIVFIKKK